MPIAQTASVDRSLRVVAPHGEPQLPVVVGRSRQTSELQRQALRAAASPMKVLITGESGVGKDLVARVIHAHSSRASRPMVAVNCAGLTETLLESELFGHVRGSFTGAHRDKTGKLQLAHRGTIFLDELGEMSPRMQALLLRFLENGEIQPVGSDTGTVKVDVRVIAATNRNLRELVAAGQFRQDLYYRLNVVNLHVAPLRERREDIRDLVPHLIARAGGSLELSEDALAALEKYGWPGNVRELQNVLEQLTWMADGRVVQAHDLPEEVRAAAVLGPRPVRERRRQVADDLFEALRAGRYNFWNHIHPLFTARDITRHDLRELVRRGLAASGGSYRALLRLFAIPAEDYKRFMNFLAAHDCSVDYREFRAAGAEGASVHYIDPHVPSDRLAG